jgi:hypothetical protein
MPPVVFLDAIDRRVALDKDHTHSGSVEKRHRPVRDCLEVL